MLVDGCPISQDAFAAWTMRLRDDIERVGASFFEATTVIAFADFAARGAEVAVVEVGLGGRLDSTNVLDPLVSGVTQIRREHTEYLGHALAQIASEKAGITKPGRPFVVGEENPELVAVMTAVATRAGALLVPVAPERRFHGALGLRGSHQRRNAAVAEAMLEQLPPRWRPNPEARARGFARARLPGRFDRRGRWIFDVAHNASGIDALARGLAEEKPERPLNVLVGILADKEWKGMLDRLAPHVDALWATQPPSAPEGRRWHLGQVAEYCGPRAVVEPDFDKALAGVQADAATVLVTGSFHTVGDAMARLPGFAPLG